MHALSLREQPRLWSIALSASITVHYNGARRNGGDKKAFSPTFVCGVGLRSAVNVHAMVKQAWAWSVAWVF